MSENWFINQAPLCAAFEQSSECIVAKWLVEWWPLISFFMSIHKSSQKLQGLWQANSNHLRHEHNCMLSLCSSNICPCGILFNKSSGFHWHLQSFAWLFAGPHASQIKLLSSYAKDFTPKVFCHEIYATDSDACGPENC